MSEKEGYYNYNKLCEFLEKEKMYLIPKKNSTYWVRYTIRRIPLYMIVGFVYFLILNMFLFSESPLKNISLELVLSSSDFFNFIEKKRVISSMLVIIFTFQWMLISFIVFLGLKSYKYNILLKISINLSLFIILIIMMNICSKNNLSYIFGLFLFSISTFLPLIIDRTLGYTRRNERYSYYISKIERLIALNKSREKLRILFSEEFILESINAIDSLYLNKNNDTVNDTLYLLSQLEKFKS